MNKIKVTIEYEWEFDSKEWKALQDWDESNQIEKVRERLEYDPVSAFYSLRNITVPTPTRVKVQKIPI